MEAAVVRTFEQVDRYLDELLGGYSPQHATLRSSLLQLVTQGRQSPHELSLPLLVHATMTGTFEPAVPVAAVHALWWRAANTFDDVADGRAGEPLYGLPAGAALTAALECGYALPLRALSDLPAPPRLRRRLCQDYLDGWTAASNGQLGDLLGEPTAVTPEAVLAVYRDKSGAIYAMACTMAARLASGESDTDAATIAKWRRFGRLLGMLAQFRNDEDDLRNGHGEDLRNGTASYLLVHLLHSVQGARYQRVRSLLAQAASCAASRHELRTLMLEPDVLRPYHAYLTEQYREAAALLDTLAPANPFASALRSRVVAEARHLPITAVTGAVCDDFS